MTHVDSSLEMLFFHTVGEQRGGVMREIINVGENHRILEVPENETRTMRAEAIEKNKIQKESFLDLKD